MVFIRNKIFIFKATISCDGGLNHEIFISYENYIVRPIKWKGISSGLIFWYKKISQDNLKKVPALKRSTLLN